MKRFKKYVETYLILVIYLLVSAYLIYQKEVGKLVPDDLRLFLILNFTCLGLGFFSFFNYEKTVRIAGLIMMISTIITTAIMLFA